MVRIYQHQDFTKQSAHDDALNQAMSWLESRERQ
ncbi:hypothetical protein OKW42_000089 [Paraburkholderia sp. WC7.3d]